MGALVPKISTGVSLGFLVALLINVTLVVYYGVGDSSTAKNFTASNIFFVGVVAASVYLTQLKESLCADTRTSLLAGLVFAVGVDCLVKSGLAATILHVLELGGGFRYGNCFFLFPFAASLHCGSRPPTP